MLPGLYNAYRWLDADPAYDPALGRRQGFSALDRRFAAALADFATRSGPWLDLVAVTGAEPIRAAYRELLDGRLPAASGLICRMSPGWTPAGAPAATSSSRRDSASARAGSCRACTAAHRR